ncbi:MAG: RecB family exonuclease [Dehalococcoidia bacterium]
MKLPPRPVARPIDSLSPSAFEVLSGCRLRMVFERDERYRPMRRLHPAAALGTACHGLVEDAEHGQFAGLADEELRAAIAASWDAHISEAYRRMSSEATHGKVPGPERWPKYQLTRARVFRMVAEDPKWRGHDGTKGPAAGQGAAVERWMRSKDGTLVGRCDRAEVRPEGVCLIDLKSSDPAAAAEDALPSAYRRQLLLYAYLWRESEGTWPKTAAIRYVNGLETMIEVDAQEAQSLAETAKEALRSFNEVSMSGQPVESYASPDPGACRFCPYRAGCRPYFEAYEPSWTPGVLSVVGVARAMGPGATAGEGYLHIEPVRPRSYEPVAVLGLRADALPTVGVSVSVVDVTLYQGGNAHTTWSSGLWEWEEPPVFPR